MRISTRTSAIGAVSLALLLAGCGLTSGSPMVDDVKPGSIGKGLPLKGADLTVTSKEFTEQLILGAIMGIAFQAAGADVLDRTGIQGSIGAREAVKGGDADAMYEYTGTAWITYQGNSKPITDPQKQWQAVRDADLKNGITWLPPATLNNTYALAINKKNEAKYHNPKTLSDVAALSKSDPKAVTLCVESEFSSRDDGLPGMQKAYGMKIPSSNITKMDTGIIYTQVSKGSCTFGEVFTTDGRIKAMDLSVMADDKHFFPNYNAAPEMNSKALKEHPEMAEVLAPITKKLNNTVARDLNSKVDVEGQDPHEVAKDWLIEEGFVKE
ncbi:glycine betaine ABC transporter substrate-binding protein [Streptomyces kanamyceticus]|uniref:Glycine betaine ABC transporter substrate-binding protein n=1 Tax=Streptomyces kanamyceticus TaxID=1967 RepID=A0A5J6GEW2_STRKN|nr:glycine betaine ABC transporter substrate-binding protein [Streptomyces kanamyceticus]QEU94089.1 glycine betaine ABC transporter substrate-binding protein [Streptomyces kanamyceticus]